MDILDLLRSDGSIVVNKNLAHNIGLQEALIYSELVSLYKYWKEKDRLTDGEWFFCTIENLQENTTLKKDAQSKAIKKLENTYKLIETKRMGLPARRYFRITDGIFGLFENQFSEKPQTDDNGDSEGEKDDEARHGQIEGLQKTSERETRKQDYSKTSSNNTRTNNTRINNQEEEIKNACANNVFYETLYDFLKEKKIDEKTINQTINLLIENNIDMASYSDVKNQFKHMMDKLTNAEVDNHNNFAKYFVNGLYMRTTQTKANQQHQEEQRLEYEKFIEQKKERASVYYNWLDD